VFYWSATQPLQTEEFPGFQQLNLFRQKSVGKPSFLRPYSEQWHGGQQHKPFIQKCPGDQQITPFIQESQKPILFS
jgi:hypothetical protein